MTRKTPKSASLPLTSSGSLKVDGDTVFIARSVLHNIARRLDVVRASAVVCRLALGAQNANCDQDIARVLQWSITEELERQIERIDHIANVQSNTAQTRRDRREKAGNRVHALATHVPRSTLKDICYRLGIAKGTTVVCHTALIRQNVEADVDVAAMLEHATVFLLQRQIDRLHAITDAKPKKGHVIAGVGQ